MTERRYTLSELDALHASVGVGPEWLASEARWDLEQDVTVPGEVIAVVDEPERT